MPEEISTKAVENVFQNTTIKIISGVMRGAEIPVRKSMMTLGRSSESDIQIHDTMISR
ncbi:MAG: hypothetical protein GXP32_09460, partial [Kiritimatiellaeota bacterium]|nr:hypothetical protein [Kiritimatiellota bacterium]